MYLTNSLSRQIFLWFLVLFTVTSSNPIPQYQEGDIIWIEGRITKYENNHNVSPVYINKTFYGLIDDNTKTVLAVHHNITQLQGLLYKNGSHLLRRDEGEDLLIESTSITPLNLSTIDFYKPHVQLLKRVVTNNPSFITTYNEQLNQSDELQKTNWTDISKYILSNFFKYVFYHVVGDAVMRFIERQTESRVIPKIVIAYETIAWLLGAAIGICVRLFVEIFKKTRDLVKYYLAQSIHLIS